MINFITAGGKANDDTAGELNLKLLHDLIANNGTAGTGPHIYFPPGVFDFSGPIRIQKQVHLEGPNAGTRANYPTTLRFPQDTQAIIVDHRNTNNLAVQSPQRPVDGAGTIIDGLYILGSASSRNNAHGVVIRTLVMMTNVQVRGFGGHGIYIVAGVHHNLGNASNCLLTACGGWECAGSGLCIEGGDANIITVVGGDFTGNGDWGICDLSFLGCTFTGVHTTQNAQPFGGFRGGTQTHLVTYPGGSGQVWAIRNNNAGSGSGTQPGTDENVWTRYYEPLNYTPPTWVLNSTFIRPGGPYLTASDAAWSPWTGCYSEGNQGPSQMGHRAVVISGDHGAGIIAVDNKTTGQPMWFDSNVGELQFKSNMRVKNLYLGYRPRAENGGFKMGAMTGPPDGTPSKEYTVNPHMDHGWAPGDFIWNEDRRTVTAGVAPPLGWRCVNGPAEFEEVPFPGSISDNSVTNAKLADVPDFTVKGRVAFGVGGDPVDVNVGTLTTHMPRFTDADNGLTQKRGIVGNEGVSNTTDFLRRDGVWTAPPGGASYTAGKNIGISGSTISVVNNPDFASDGGTTVVRRTGSALHADRALYVENTWGNHSWGMVGEFRVANGNDRPSLAFSHHAGESWSVGMFEDDYFKIKNRHGFRYGGWGLDYMNIAPVSGNMWIKGTLQQSSDARLKENVRTIEGALDKVCRMRGVTFTVKDSGLRSSGVIAQELEPVAPELVAGEGDEMKSVAYANSVAYLIEAIKELRAQNADLATRVEAVEARD